MIRLSETETLDNYFIDENGVITNESGNVQELKIYQGRPRFKGQYIHKIMMYTFYGWRDGKIWAIHHKDENKLNNSLENLVYITRSEHTSIHSKGNNVWEGKHLSEETRKKISESMKGNKYALGYHHSEETKQKISESTKGINTWTKSLHWFNDGVKNYRCKECPPNCIKGRIYKKNK